jgi:hypothetical protein
MAKRTINPESKEYRDKQYLIINGEKVYRKDVKVHKKFPDLSADGKKSLQWFHPSDPVVEKGIDTSVAHMMLKATRGDIQVGRYNTELLTDDQKDEMLAYPDPRPTDNADAAYSLATAKIKYEAQQKRIKDLKTRKAALEKLKEAKAKVDETKTETKITE